MSTDSMPKSEASPTPAPVKLAGMLERLHARRSVSARFLVEPGPDVDQIEELLTLAMRVPDHGKLAPWRFIVLDRATRESLRARFLAVRGLSSDDPEAARFDKQLEAFAAPPVCIVVVSCALEHPAIPIFEQHMSAGASAMALIVAAQAMGFSSNWLTGWAATDPRAKALLGVDPEEEIVGFVHIGTALAPPTERPRPQLADHLTFGVPSGSQ